MPFGAKTLERMSDYRIWYAKDINKIKYNSLFIKKNVEGASRWNLVELKDGTRRKLSKEEWKNHSLLPEGSRVYRHSSLKPCCSSTSRPARYQRHRKE